MASGVHFASLFTVPLGNRFMSDHHNFSMPRNVRLSEWDQPGLITPQSKINQSALPQCGASVKDAGPALSQRLDVLALVEQLTLHTNIFSYKAEL